ncbi:MaoC family dehydratase N-terminal domain-containing protein [Chelatococcus reniformis]|jgi:acyl dehydratase|uniref:FAS1-like dehydratase domain-containing protein n=1 Tax=Chelatococcus reniformis TaxID=1494448 RepID=A0A916UPV4_9HYPH|nr:MaoC family dehydratase N-terminal domain-containing protein [Chelatococcus reniformis]GGC82462.1 hypothetical protein GCM10010994_45470 [Chelatococcus reniformis]
MLDRSIVGQTRPATRATVEPKRLRFFLKAIGEEGAIYHDKAAAQAAGFRDIPVPPTYLFCLQMMDAERPFALTEDLGVDVGRLLHGEQGFRYHKPVYVGDELTFTTRIVDMADKKGGAMTIIAQETRVENGAGEHVADLTGTTVVRNPGAGQ